MRLDAKSLRTKEPDQTVKLQIKRNPIFIICDNVLDTYNIGAIFRLADAIAAEKVYLCRDTQTPPDPKIKKASINTWKWVEWEYSSSTLEVIKKLKTEVKNIKICSVEQSNRSISWDKLNTTYPVAVVVGNETDGISNDVLDLSDLIVELPMYGINKSLNVMVSLGIILYKIIENNIQNS
jgi:23S rRNA (guanosine2251-2'-O)-methyltransferase